MRLTASLQLLLLALCLLCTPARAQQADLNEALQSVRASLEALPDSGASEAERRELQEIFQQTIGFLQRSQSLQGEQVALREQIDRAPQSSRDVRLQLERLKTVDGETLRRNAGRQDLVSLEQALELRVTQMFNWQNELTAVRPGEQPVDQGRADIADVQLTRGRRSETNLDGHEDPASLKAKAAGRPLVRFASMALRRRKLSTFISKMVAW